MPSFAAQSELLTSQKGHPEDITAKSGISNQDQAHKEKKQASLSLSFQAVLMHFKKKTEKKMQGLPPITSTTPYTGEKCIRNINGGLTRQKRSKEMVSSHKSLAASE